MKTDTHVICAQKDIIFWWVSGTSLKASFRWCNGQTANIPFSTALLVYQLLVTKG